MRLLFLSDTHFTRAKNVENPVWLNRLIINKWDEIKEDFISGIKLLRPDVIIHCGDFTHFGTIMDFEYGKEILDATGIDWYAVPGNHDTYSDEIVNEMRSLFGAEDMKGFCYSKTFGGIAIAFFDVCVRRKDNLFFVDDDVLDWLENFLIESFGRTVFLVCHIPVRHRTVISDQGTFNCGEKVIRGRVFGRYFDKVLGKIENVNKLRKLISLHSNVKAVVSGHWHINSLHLSSGVHYKIIPSICEYPCEVVLADCEKEGNRICNKTLDTLNLQEKSIVTELNNEWVSGPKKERDTLI